MVRIFVAQVFDYAFGLIEFPPLYMRFGQINESQAAAGAEALDSLFVAAKLVEYQPQIDAAFR